MKKQPVIKSPFPYFGGKSKVANIIWERLGDVQNYIEPFCGSAAVLMRRPEMIGVETINDKDCMVANFWRATQHEPGDVAYHASQPVNEADLHARHRWLVLSDDAKKFRHAMKTDPHYFDAKIAGWWCWGLCCWIGGGWCTPHGETESGDRNEARPMLSQETKGCVGGVGTLHQKRPNIGNEKGAVGTFFNQTPILSGSYGAVGSLRNKMPKDRPCASANGRPQLADAFARGRGVHGNDNKVTCEDRVAWLVEWFSKIRDRLRQVRVCCGDWLRVCDSPSVTTRLGLTGIFFDPPYGDAADRDMNLYAEESGKVASDVLAYCLERGNDPMMRIILAGYAGEGHEVLEQNGWTVIEWAAQGGYGNRSSKGKGNAKKERLWYSPHCVREAANLFSDAA